MPQATKLELLAPAKNLECGIAAIHHGADAVYIGAPKFGAREAAGNSIGEIEKLAAEARVFKVKTYVALNTILYDQELEEAEKIIRQVYEAGADALIIQDFGILEMDLPPIALHASTQANNFTVGKLKFLEAVGFERAVLARELSLDQIKEIREETSIELEAFVHGSLCVSLSGQCYMSHALGGRSANRGACAQPCRKKYTLTDATGQVIVRDKHMLSLKDLDRSGSIREMAEAGIRSFKIEGRLKEADYVKNITAWYRLELDRILEEKPAFTAASLGKTTFYFTPEPMKTFHRGATDYFLRGRKNSVAAMDSSKSTGEEIGVVSRLSPDGFQIEGAAEVANNDGLTFLNRDGESLGLKVNKVENGTIYPDRMNGVFVGAKIFRNYDHSFQKELSARTSERKIPVSFILESTEKGFALRTPDSQSFEQKITKIKAHDIAKSRENILRQLAKLGETHFVASAIDTCGNEEYFFTVQQINDLRRGLLSILTQKERTRQPLDQSENHLQKPSQTSSSAAILPLPVETLPFENNISNRLSRQFYRKHGLENPESAVEKRAPSGRQQVMITKMCLQHELGFCPKFGGTFPAHLSLPFYLTDGDNRFELGFDCIHCMMRILVFTPF